MMSDNGVCKTKLCPVSLGIAIGITDALFMMLFSWSAWQWGYGMAMMDMMTSMYPGMAPTLVGGLIGGLWGLLDGFLFGVIVGAIYNCCMCRCCGRKACASCEKKNM